MGETVTANSTTVRVLDRVDAGLDASLARLCDWLSIRSISSQPAHDADCDRAADWLSRQLETTGFDVSLRKTTGHKLVLAKCTAQTSAAPHALFYGHYDVQPVDPLELWDHDPFAPDVVAREDGSRVIRGRGASDDKGQVMTFVEACRAWREVAGALPISLTLAIEGDEETDSAHLTRFVEANPSALAADIALVCDTSMWDSDTPALSVSLRGMLGVEVIVRAADRDLHSGHYGNAARNPLALLCQILADLRDEAGGVTLPGFYDGVSEATVEQKAVWETLDASALLSDIGLSVPAGEQGRGVLEQTWARPTAEICGMTGGYTGDGFKTVIPAEARAKVSFRLVGTQDPEAIEAEFREHVNARLPADCSAEFISHGGSRAVSLPSDSAYMVAAETALAEEWGKTPLKIGMGGSIPVVTDFKHILGLDTILAGFALESDNIHSPNEKYDLRSFHKGIRSWVRILAALAELEKQRA